MNNQKRNWQNCIGMWNIHKS